MTLYAIAPPEPRADRRGVPSAAAVPTMPLARVRQVIGRLLDRINTVQSLFWALTLLIFATAFISRRPRRARPYWRRSISAFRQ
ncbi:MAG: hypothetical protein ACT6U0_28970, partial [Shinella sp.]